MKKKNLYTVLLIIVIAAAIAFLWACQPNPYDEPDYIAGGSLWWGMTTVIPSGSVTVTPMSPSESEVFKKALTIAPYKIAPYEVTYELWYTVRVWAEAHGYEFANTGWEGHRNTKGAPPSAGGKTMPVTGISWRDAIVWCNAYSEMAGLVPVYTYRDIDLVLNPPAHDFGGSSPSQNDLTTYTRDQLFGPGSSQEIPDRTSVWNYAPPRYDVWVYNASSDTWTNTGDAWTHMTTGGGIDYSYHYIDVNKNVTLKDSTNSELCDRVELTIANTGYRLPTEAEWEFAARGGVDMGPSWDATYAGSVSPDDAAWYRGTSFPELPAASGNKEYGIHPVGDRKIPNSLGLYDMSGNVSEWCWDIYVPDTGAITSPEGPVLSDEYISSSYPTIKTPWSIQPDGKHPAVATVLPVSDPFHANMSIPDKLEYVPKVMGKRDSGVARGGSWYDYAEKCEVRAREKGPSAHIGYTGFRLVCKP